MLKKVRFKNYRCLRDVQVELDPFVVLVGANASGKSTILQGLCARGINDQDRWRHDSTAAMLLEFEYDDGRRASWQLPSGEPLKGAGPRHSSLLLHLDLNATRQQNLLSAQSSFASDGDRLSNVFATLTRSLQAEVVRQFCDLVPMFSDLNFRPTRKGSHTFVFEDRWSKTELSPNEVSDGTMLVLSYLLLLAQHQQDQVDLLAIEEPERGLHPFLLGEIVRLFRNMATGKLGRQVQVIVATHSAELLDHVQPSEVRFVSRDAATGEVSIEQPDADSPSLQAAFREYQGSLGNLWLSGGLGGVPGT